MVTNSFRESPRSAASTRASAGHHNFLGQVGDGQTGGVPEVGGGSSGKDDLNVDIATL